MSMAVMPLVFQVLDNTSFNGVRQKIGLVSHLKLKAYI